MFDSGCQTLSVRFSWKRVEKLQKGKDIAQKDKNVFNNAEKLLFEELSLSFNIQKNEVLDFIMSKVTI